MSQYNIAIIKSNRNVLNIIVGRNLKEFIKNVLKCSCNKVLVNSLMHHAKLQEFFISCKTSDKRSLVKKRTPLYLLMKILTRKRVSIIFILWYFQIFLPNVIGC